MRKQRGGSCNLGGRALTATEHADRLTTRVGTRPRHPRRFIMAKGQIRSNKEKKKPKQDKSKKTAPASPFGGIQVKSNPPTENK